MRGMEDPMTRDPAGRAALLALGLALAACNRGPADPIQGGSANYSASLGDDPDFSEPNGRIVVETWLDYGETSLSGFFAAGPQPRSHVESQRIGNCRLMTFTASPCDPYCEDSVCVDGECVDYPDREDRGALDWTWPDGQQTVQPDALLGYYATGSASDTGEVTIEVDGMTLEAPSTERPEQDGDWNNVLSGRNAGEDATLRWKNPYEHARVRVRMTDCIGSHGGLAPAEIECEGPDTGELVLPGAFVDALDAGDWSHGECGSHDFERYHAAAPVGDDTIRFETVSDAGFFYRPGW